MTYDLFDFWKKIKIMKAKRQRAIKTGKSIVKFIVLSVAIIVMAKQIKVIAWTCLTMEKDYKHPLLILAQLTHSQLCR